MPGPVGDCADRGVRGVHRARDVGGQGFTRCTHSQVGLGSARRELVEQGRDTLPNAARDSLDGCVGCVHRASDLVGQRLRAGAQHPVGLRGAALETGQQCRDPPVGATCHVVDGGVRDIDRALHVGNQHLAGCPHRRVGTGGPGLQGGQQRRDLLVRAAGELLDGDVCALQRLGHLQGRGANLVGRLIGEFGDAAAGFAGRCGECGRHGVDPCRDQVHRRRQALLGLADMRPQGRSLGTGRGLGPSGEGSERAVDGGDTVAEPLCPGRELVAGDSGDPGERGGGLGDGAAQAGDDGADFALGRAGGVGQRRLCPGQLLGPPGYGVGLAAQRCARVVEAGSGAFGRGLQARRLPVERGRATVQRILGGACPLGELALAVADSHGGVGQALGREAAGAVQRTGAVVQPLLRLRCGPGDRLGRGLPAGDRGLGLAAAPRHHGRQAVSLALQVGAAMVQPVDQRGGATVEQLGDRLQAGVGSVERGRRFPCPQGDGVRFGAGGLAGAGDCLAGAGCGLDGVVGAVADRLPHGAELFHAMLGVGLQPHACRIDGCGGVAEPADAERALLAERPRASVEGGAGFGCGPGEHDRGGVEGGDLGIDRSPAVGARRHHLAGAAAERLGGIGERRPGLAGVGQGSGAAGVERSPLLGEHPADPFRPDLDQAPAVVEGDRLFGEGGAGGCHVATHRLGPGRDRRHVVAQPLGHPPHPDLCLAGGLAEGGRLALHRLTGAGQCVQVGGRQPAGGLGGRGIAVGGVLQLSALLLGCVGEGLEAGERGPACGGHVAAAAAQHGGDGPGLG